MSCSQIFRLEQHRPLVLVMFPEAELDVASQYQGLHRHFEQSTPVLLVSTVLSRQMIHSCSVDPTTEVSPCQQCLGTRVEAEGYRILGANGQTNSRVLLLELTRPAQVETSEEQGRQEGLYCQTFESHSQFDLE